MTITQMHFFLELADLRNFTIAADRLYTTQPTLSRQIKSMEDELGVQLFVRSGNAIYLTPAGRELYKGLKKICGEYDDLCDKVLATVEGMTGELRIAVLFDQLLGERMTKAIHSYMGRYPDIRITIRRMNFRQIHSSLLSRDIDIGITFKHNESFDSRIGFFGETNEPPHMALPRAFPLTDKDHLTGEDVLAISQKLPYLRLSPRCFEQKAVVPGGSFWENAVGPANTLYKRRYLDDVETIPVYVSAGLGFALANSTNILAIDPNVRLLPFTDGVDIIKACCYFIGNDTPIIKAFMEIYAATPENGE